MELTDLLNKGVGPEMTDVVSTGRAVRLGWGDKRRDSRAEARDQGWNSPCILTNALWQSSSTNGY